MAAAAIVQGLGMVVLVKDLADIHSSLKNNEILMQPTLTWAKNTGEKYDRAMFVAEETPVHDLIHRGIPNYAAYSDRMERFKEIEILTNNKEFFYEIETFSKRELVPQSDIIHVLKMYANKHTEMKLAKKVIRKLGVIYLDEGFEDPNAFVIMGLTCTVITM